MIKKTTILFAFIALIFGTEAIKSQSFGDFSNVNFMELNDSEIDLLIRRATAQGFNQFDLLKMAIDINGVNKMVVNKMDVLDQVQKWCLYSGLSMYEFESRQDIEHWLLDSLEDREVDIMFSGNKEAI